MSNILELIRKGDLEKLKNLRVDICNMNFDFLSEPIIIAVQSGHIEIVKYLCERGANIHIYNYVPIQWASFYGYLEIVKYLCERAADVKSIESFLVKLASQKSHHEVVKYLYERGADISEISEDAKKYISFCEKMKNKVRERAQRRIYFWWIPICYDITRDCGKRMMLKNLEKAKELGMEFI
jgi:ankyrin repeat protein